MIPKHACGGTLRLLAALLVAAPAAAQAQGLRTDFSVVQLNDVYRIDAVENGTAGGLGRVATLVQRVRRETGRPVYLFHAGDFIAPSLESRYFAGQQMIAAMNFLHRRAPLLVVPGNHEFDASAPATLAGALGASEFPWLATNLSVRTGDAAADARLARDTVVTLGTTRVGVFALTYLDAPRSYAQADTAVVAAAQDAIRRLEQRGAEVIVGLTHLDLATDRAIARLRRAHPRFLWIAGGHEHYLLRHPLTDTTALITKGDANARRVWQVRFGRRGDELAVEADSVVLDQRIAPDPAYQREVAQRWRAELARRIPLLDQQIGHSATPLDGREETVRDAESSWGNWLADRMRTAFPDVPADVAVLNGGAIRIDDVVTGTLRWEHLERTFGFPTRVGLVWLRGRDLRQTVLERAVSGGRGEGRFLQVSGLRFAFDRGRQPGERVSAVEVRRGEGWEPLRDDGVYVVAVPDYLYGGGDGYHFKDRALLTVPPGPDLKLLALDALLQAHSRGESIAPRVEGRIREIGETR